MRLSTDNVKKKHCPPRHQYWLETSCSKYTLKSAPTNTLFINPLSETGAENQERYLFLFFPAVLPVIFSVPAVSVSGNLFRLILYEIGQKNHDDKYRGGSYRKIKPRRVLNEVREISEIRYRKQRLSYHVPAVNRGAVGSFVRVSLCSESYHPRLFFVGNDLDYPVRGDRLFVKHEGYRVADLQLLCLHRLYIKQ